MFERLRRHYRTAVCAYGPVSPLAVYWRRRFRHEVRRVRLWREFLALEGMDV